MNKKALKVVCYTQYIYLLTFYSRGRGIRLISILFSSIGFIFSFFVTLIRYVNRRNVRARKVAVRHNAYRRVKYQCCIVVVQLKENCDMFALFSL